MITQGRFNLGRNTHMHIDSMSGTEWSGQQQRVTSVMAWESASRSPARTASAMPSASATVRGSARRLLPSPAGVWAADMGEGAAVRPGFSDRALVANGLTRPARVRVPTRAAAAAAARRPGAASGVASAGPVLNAARRHAIRWAAAAATRMAAEQKENGHRRDRTDDHCLIRAMLYHLS